MCNSTCIKFCVKCFVLLTFFTLPVKSQATVGDYARTVCDEASSRAANLTEVPIIILKAIARTESGTTRNGEFGPWPWTINVEGQGVYLETMQSAEKYITSSLKDGYTNIDIGCFQVNYRWHGRHFSNVGEMLDPNQNALYAATFLSRLYREFGNWERAAGAYHSRNQEYSDAYLSKFRPILSSLDTGMDSRRSTDDPESRPNLYPLLIVGDGSQTPGSLFSDGGKPRQRFIRNTFLRE